MSQMQRCAQGHFYDASRHRRCPTCGIPGLEVGYTVPASAMNELPPTPPGGVSHAAQGANKPATDAPTRRLGSNPQPDAPTVAFWRKRKPPPEGPAGGTSAGDTADALIDPVVGWLVAIDGPAKGRDFRVFSEGNEIGRANHFRIVIKDDETISQRDPHAVITFDPRGSDAAYYIQPGGRHLVYVMRQGANSREVVLAPTRLQAYDIIELGKSKLLFVPLCNEWFRWQMSDDDSPSP